MLEQSKRFYMYGKNKLKFRLYKSSSKEFTVTPVLCHIDNNMSNFMSSTRTKNMKRNKEKSSLKNGFEKEG